MGKSYRDRPDNWKNNKHFQKKQKQKHKGQKPFESTPTDDILNDAGHSPYDDMTDYGHSQGM